MTVTRLPSTRPTVCTAVGLLALVLAPSAGAQELPGCYLRGNPTPEEAADRPSPPANASTEIGGGEIEVCYGSPRANDRVVMGELVPWNAPWRTGANEATAIHTTVPVEIAGIRVEPGSYSLYTTPTPGDWTLHLNTSVERWGIPISPDVLSTEVGAAAVPTETLDEHVENMTFRFEPTDGGVDLLLEWELTRVRIPVRPVG